MIDEHGEAVVADLRFYYQVDIADVIQLRIPPPIALAYVARLPDESAFAAHATAKRHGHEKDWRTYLGWGDAVEALANIYDAISQNTRATGNWKNSPPDIPSYPTPRELLAKAKEKKQPATVASLFARMTARM